MSIVEGTAAGESNRHAAHIAKRSGALADGREIIYFDDADTSLAGERAVDRRTLDPRPETAVMRQDVLTGDWVSFAAARQNRVVMPPKELDPLAPQSDTNPSEVPSNYDVVVFENRSPSFGPALATSEVADAPTDAGLTEIALGASFRSVGRCEVVCFSPDSDGSFASQSVSRARTIIEAWTDRTRELSKLPGIRQVFPFENRGKEIGVTLPHPHGQIYGYPYITPRTSMLIRQVAGYAGDLFEDIIAYERASERVVLETANFMFFVPFAARWPIEIHALPLRHAADFTELTDAERDELAPALLRVLRGVDAMYDSPTPYIAAWHQAPVAQYRDRIRLMLQITSPRRGSDKLKYLAGSEAAMGAWIGDVAPETVAQRLRDAIDRADANSPAGDATA